MGRHLLELGVTPGPDMRRLLDECYETQLDGGLSYATNKLAFVP
jgi:tRNA nucleotidyltransferase (CCA-adding enzyme)